VEGLVMSPDFWRGKKVFLTGHTGFKGSWLSLWLARGGADVTGYALDPPTTPSLFEAARVADSVRSISGDIRDRERVRTAVAESKADVVIHMAAQALVRSSYENPVETYDVNVVGTASVLDAVRHASTVRVVVVVTSDKCYENRESERPYRETDPMGGADPYSSSKGCAELVASAYDRSYFRASGMRLATARAGNVIGGGDWGRDRLVPDVVTAFARQQAPVIRNPDAVRPWQHVLEPLAGYLLLAERLWAGDQFGGGWNFGPADDDARPVRWLVDRLAAQWGNGASWTHRSDGGPEEAQLLRLDTSRARRELGWKPRLPLDETLRWVAEWYRQYDADPSTARALVERELTRYEALP
jgi:CDP-glucose 4,6-dehydratase